MTDKKHTRKDEEWKSIEGYEGRYEVSSLGRVRSLLRRDSRNRRCPSVMLRPAKTKTGYLQVCLKKGKQHHQTHYVHRLVAHAFLPKDCDAQQINHKNTIKTDNSINNLEWVTPAENMNHAHQNGLLKWFKVGYDERRSTPRAGN